jgi:hypothetical protein
MFLRFKVQYRIQNYNLIFLVANATLFGYLFHRYKYNMEVDEEKIDIYNISVGVCLWFLSARCGLEAWMHWSFIDVIVLGFKSVEELYPSLPLSVDSADTSPTVQGEDFAWTIPILPTKPARQ